MKVIPSMDLLNGKVVRLFQGDYEQVTVYYDDPCDALEMLKEKGASRIHIVNLDGARYGQEDRATNLNFEVIKRLIKKYASSFHFQVGGGIRSLEDVEQLLEIGTDKVVIGSLIFTNYDEYRKIVEQYGEKIVLALDVKEGIIKRNGWLIDTNMKIEEIGRASCRERV